jgi:hypothetical protein
MPNLSLGYALPLNERFFLEFGSNFKLSGKGFGLISLSTQLKYEF